MPSHPGFLISLSGIDGCGKSTLARQLQEYFSFQYGLPCRRVWCKFGAHPLSNLHLSNLIKRASGQPAKNSIPSSFPAPQIYARALLLIHLTHIFLAVRQKLLRGEYLICDRYIFDTAVDLQQEIQYSTEKIAVILSIGWLPMPDLKFWLDLPEKLAYQRKPDSASLPFLRQRRALYREIAQEFDLHLIDASLPLDAVFDQLIEIIQKESKICVNLCRSVVNSELESKASDFQEPP